MVTTNEAVRSYSSALVILCALTYGVAAGEDRSRSSAAPASHLVFQAPDFGLTPAKEAGRQTELLLASAAVAPTFYCSVSQDCLRTILPERVNFRSAFRDILVGIPVHGEAEVAGTLKINLLPDEENARFEVLFVGTVRMDGVGDVRGIRINSDMTTQIRSAQRFSLDRRGLKYGLTHCTARSAMIVRQIRSRPRLASPLYERIASRRVADTTAAAELQCSRHVESAIGQYMDNYVASVAKSVNAAIRNSERSLTQEQRQLHLGTTFRTEADRFVVLRGVPDPSLLADEALLRKPLLFCVPRTRFGQNIGVILQLLNNDDVTQIAAFGKGPRQLDVARRALYRPSLELHSHAPVISLDSTSGN